MTLNSMPYSIALLRNEFVKSIETLVGSYQQHPIVRGILTIQRAHLLPPFPYQCILLSTISTSILFTSRSTLLGILHLITVLIGIFVRQLSLSLSLATYATALDESIVLEKSLPSGIAIFLSSSCYT